ncbi:hypothetical protein [Streptomyces sp. SYSU K217416]
MSMISTASTAATSNPTGLLIFLAALGAAGTYGGARWVFNLRGAVDATLQRRRAVLELKGQRSGNLSVAGNDPIGPWFFKLCGSVIGLAGLVLLAMSLILINPTD